jgi:cysteine/O-acetylserine efflux protein
MINLTAFMSYVFVTTFTPGPNNIMSMSNALRYGFRKSIPFNIGVFFGFFIIIGLCSLFSVTLYNFIPSIKSAMTYVGAAYILWLAWKTYKSKTDNKGENTSELQKESERSTNTFLTGFALQFVNPKVILYGITTVSTFIVPYYKSVLMLTMFSALLAFIGFVATCCWSLFGSIFQRLLMEHDRAINIAMTVLLIYCAASLFF